MTLSFTQFRYPAKKYVNGEHVGPGEWLDLIHEANRVCQLEGNPPLFDVPESEGQWWAGGYVEEYPTTRVLHREDDSVSVIAKTEEAARVLVDADRNLTNKRTGGRL